MHATVDRTTTKQWDAKSVRDALAMAFRVLNATTGAAGHKGLKASMPEYEYSAANIAEQKLMEVEAQRKGETTMRKRLLARIKPNSHEISRSDLILFGKGENVTCSGGAVLFLQSAQNMHELEKQMPAGWRRYGTNSV